MRSVLRSSVSHKSFPSAFRLLLCLIIQSKLGWLDYWTVWCIQCILLIWVVLFQACYSWKPCVFVRQLFGEWGLAAWMASMSDMWIPNELPRSCHFPARSITSCLTSWRWSSSKVGSKLCINHLEADTRSVFALLSIHPLQDGEFSHARLRGTPRAKKKRSFMIYFVKNCHPYP